MSGKSFYDFSFTDYKDSLACIDDETGEVYGIGGVVPQADAPPIIWALCTTAVDNNHIKFLRFTKYYLGLFLRYYPLLWNYVWLGNKQHVHWLKWLGAEFHEEVIINDNKFQQFSFKRKE